MVSYFKCASVKWRPFYINNTGAQHENQNVPRNRLSPPARRHRRQDQPGHHPGESFVLVLRDRGCEVSEAGKVVGMDFGLAG